jgi:hypothetical protein
MCGVAMTTIFFCHWFRSYTTVDHLWILRITWSRPFCLFRDFVYYLCFSRFCLLSLFFEILFIILLDCIWATLFQISIFGLRYDQCLWPYSITHANPSFHNSEVKQLSPLCFAMLWDIDLIFDMCKLQIKFTFRSGSMIVGRVMALGLWNLAKYLVVTTFFSLCLEILTWFLVYECIMMSYRSSLHFVPVQWILANLQPLSFEIWANI